MPFPRGAEQEMLEVSITQFTGLFDTIPPDRIPPGAAADLQNIIPGLCEKRKGTDNLLTAALAGTIQGLFPYYLQGSGARHLLMTVNGELRRWDGAGSTVSIRTGLNTSNRAEFANLKDVCYYTLGNATDGYRYWDGTTDAKVTASADGDNDLNDPTSPIHACRYVTVWNDRLFLGGPSTQPFSIWPADRSALLTVNRKADYFKATERLDIHSKEGGKLTGMVPGQDVLFAIKDDSIHGIFADASFNLSRKVLLPDRGVPSGRTAISTPIGLVFQADDGHVHVLEGASGLESRWGSRRLTKHIGKTIQGLNKAALANAAAFFYDRYYWLAVPNGASTTPNMVLVCDLSQITPAVDEQGRVDPTAFHAPWSKYVFPTSWRLGSAFAVFDNGSTETFLAGDAAQGQVWKLEQGAYNDDGTAVNAWWLSGKYHFGRAQWKKDFDDMYVVYEGLATASDLTVSVYIDDRNPVSLSPIDMIGNPTKWGNFIWGTDTWGVRQGNRTKRKPLNKTGVLLQVRLGHSAADKKMSIFEVGFSYSMDDHV